MDPHEIFPSIFNHALFCILHSITPQCPHLQIFCTSLAKCHTLLHQNCLRIKSVLTLSSSHVNVNLPTPNYHPSTFDTIHNMLNGYTIFPSSHNPLSGNDIGLHTIRTLITLDSWFLIQERCNLILVCCIQIPINYTYIQSICTSMYPIFIMSY